MTDVDFEVVLAQRVFGLIQAEELPALALRALEAGYDSASLAALAGESTRSMSRDLWDLLDEVVSELGVQQPSRLKAAGLLKLHYARAVARGELNPREGAQRIIGVHRDIEHMLPDGQFAGSAFGIERVYGLYYSHDDVWTDAEHASIDSDLLAEFRRLAAGSENADK
jgi:hypothetical protein